MDDVSDFLARPFEFDLRSLALFRVGLGTLLIFDLINRGLWLRAHYTDFGVLPRQALLDTLWDRAWLSVHMLSGTFWPQLILFVMTGIAALAMVVGYKTRIATAVAWFLVISLHGRNPMVLQGGDIVFRLFLFWAMFLPLGARYSVDAALDPNGEPRGSEENTFISAGTVAFIGQLCFIYAFAAILKDAPQWRETFSATHYALAIDQFTTPVGDFLFQYKGLLKYLTIYTLLLEAFAWILILVPVGVRYVRLAAIALFVSMHLGFAVSMQLGLFSYIVSVGWLALLPGVVWERLAERLGSFGEEIEIRIARPGSIADKLARIARTFLFVPGATIIAEPGDEDGLSSGWGVTVGDSGEFRRFEGCAALVAASPVFSKLTRLSQTFPRLREFARSAWNRAAESRWVRRAFETGCAVRTYRVRQSVIAGVVCIAAMGTAFWWNMQTVNSRYSVRQPLRTIAVYFRIDQKWNMFAPYPLKDDGWYVIAGKLRDGRKVDLFQDNSPPEWDKPDDVSSTYPNQRWRKYMMNLWLAKYSDQRLYYGRYLCRKWNATHAGADTLMTFKIYFMKEKTLADGVADPEKNHLWSHHCFESPEDAVEGEELDHISDTFLKGLGEDE